MKCLILSMTKILKENKSKINSVRALKFEIPKTWISKNYLFLMTHFLILLENDLFPLIRLHLKLLSPQNRGLHKQLLVSILVVNRVFRLLKKINKLLGPHHRNDDIAHWRQHQGQKDHHGDILDPVEIGVHFPAEKAKHDENRGKAGLDPGFVWEIEVA